MGRSIVIAVAGVAAAAAVWGYVLLAPSQEADACGTYGPFDFDTYESATSRDTYRLAINLAAEGKLVPETFVAGGETIDLRYQGLLRGPRSARTGDPDPSLRVPPSIYYSIAWIEANWANAAHTVPWGGVGPTLRSFDCGYGLGQITSGMGNNSGAPTAKQALVGTHFAFNLAEGMRILADKWNQAPRYRPIAGEGDPAALEDWYFAIWSYNGFAFSNHPLNPDRDPLRAGSADSPIYHCFDGSAPSYVPGSGSLPAYTYGDYTYPERVYGCMRHPPSVSEQRNPANAGELMWQPVTFNMPDFENELVAGPFAPANFQNCDALVDGCASMDFPTSFPELGVTTNVDIVPATDPAQRSAVLGGPSLSFNAPGTLDLAVSEDAIPETAAITATNNGTFVAPFRIRSNVPWIVVRHPGDAASITLDGSIAVGADVEVVTLANPRRTKQGHVAEMLVSVDYRHMEKGTQTGTLTLEPLWGGGSAATITVNGTSPFEAPPTPTPVPTATPTAPSSPTATPTPAFQAHVPNVSTDE